MWRYVRGRAHLEYFRERSLPDRGRISKVALEDDAVRLDGASAQVHKNLAGLQGVVPHQGHSRQQRRLRPRWRTGRCGRAHRGLFFGRAALPAEAGVERRLRLAGRGESGAALHTTLLPSPDPHAPDRAAGWRMRSRGTPRQLTGPPARRPRARCPRQLTSSTARRRATAADAGRRARARVQMPRIRPSRRLEKAGVACYRPAQAAGAGRRGSPTPQRCPTCRSPSTCAPRWARCRSCRRRRERAKPGAARAAQSEGRRLPTRRPAPERGTAWPASPPRWASARGTFPAAGGPGPPCQGSG